MPILEEGTLVRFWTEAHPGHALTGRVLTHHYDEVSGELRYDVEAVFAPGEIETIGHRELRALGDLDAAAVEELLASYAAYKRGEATIDGPAAALVPLLALAEEPSDELLLVLADGLSREVPDPLPAGAVEPLVELTPAGEEAARTLPSLAEAQENPETARCFAQIDAPAAGSVPDTCLRELEHEPPHYDPRSGRKWVDGPAL